MPPAEKKTPLRAPASAKTAARESNRDAPASARPKSGARSRSPAKKGKKKTAAKEGDVGASPANGDDDVTDDAAADEDALQDGDVTADAATDEDALQDGEEAPAAATPPKLLRHISKQQSISQLERFQALGSAPKESDAAEAEAETKGSMAKAEPPRMVRGKTGLVKKRDHADEAIAELVAGVLPNWAGIDTEEIQVRDVSGHGGSKTYKVTAPEGTEPPCVALHSRSESVTSEEISEPRLMAAAIALHQAGLAPRRLAQGGDWYIVEWAGKALGQPFGGCDATEEELGTMLARIHKVPTDWYAPFRDKIRAQMPAFTRVLDEGNHAWWYSARGQEWLDGFDGDEMATWAALLPPPVSKLGRRIVTVHGDFHAGNLIRDSDDGTVLKAIDLEFAGVFYAAHDLSYAPVLCNINSAAKKRAFFAAYIAETNGAPATAEEVNDLAVDAELFIIGRFFGPLACFHLKGDDGEGSMMFKLLLKRVQIEHHFKKCVDARADVTKLDALLEKGLLGSGHGAMGQHGSIPTTLDASSIPLFKELLARDPTIVAAATAPAVFNRALTLGYMPLAIALIESGADITIAREALLKDDAKLLMTLVKDSDGSMLDTLCALDEQIKTAANTSENFVAALKPSSAAAALRMLEGGADVTAARDALLANGAKLLGALVVDPKCDTLIEALCAKDEQIKAVATSPELQLELLVASLQPSTWELGLKLLQEQGIPHAVRAALTEGDAAVTPTHALSFDGSQWLSDDGTDVPLGNSAYTWEFWARFTGHGCFASIGTAGHGHASGFHFDHGSNINHCAFVDRMHNAHAHMHMSCDHSPFNLPFVSVCRVSQFGTLGIFMRETRPRPSNGTI